MVPPRAIHPMTGPAIEPFEDVPARGAATFHGLGLALPRRGVTGATTCLRSFSPKASLAAGQKSNVTMGVGFFCGCKPWPAWQMVQPYCAGSCVTGLWMLPEKSAAGHAVLRLGPWSRGRSRSGLLTRNAWVHHLTQAARGSEPSFVASRCPESAAILEPKVLVNGGRGQQDSSTPRLETSNKSLFLFMAVMSSVFGPDAKATSKRPSSARGNRCRSPSAPGSRTGSR